MNRTTAGLLLVILGLVFTGGASADRLRLVEATQSSTSWDGYPSRAIDGNTNGNYWSHSCTHTSGTSSNWWMATFERNAAVSKVVIYNRRDCCSERINGAKVYVGHVFCGEVRYRSGTVSYEVQCGNAVGGTVKIVQNDNKLTLCEVQVFGVASAATPLVNIAQGAVTLQTSEGHGGAASRAVDGRVNGHWGHGTCSHSGSTTYSLWKAYLPSYYKIRKVVIHNRIDCCADRINGVKVYVENSLCGTVSYTSGKAVYEVDCGGRMGGWIKITKTYNYLMLCEVEVLAN